VSVLPRMTRAAGPPAAGAAAAPVRRRWWGLGWLALGAALLALSGLPVSAHSLIAAAVRLLLGRRAGTAGGRAG
jgi:hypothetical protein